MPERSWSLLNTRQVADHRIFRVRYDRYRLETSGGEQDFVVLEAPNWVNIVPVTEQAICPNMKMITLEKVHEALRENRHVIHVPEDIRVKAEQALQRMLDVV